MKLTVPVFRGEAPRISPRLLDGGYAQRAQGARLLTGDLEAWQDLKQRSVQVRTGAVGSNTTAAALAKASPINTIALMAKQYWLQWRQNELAAGETNVDVARGPVPGDTTQRTYFTGTALGPQVTDIDMATAPANQGASAQGAYPYTSLPLGVEAPEFPPTVTQQTSETAPDNITKTYDGSDITDFTSTGGSISQLIQEVRSADSRIPSAPYFYSYINGNRNQNGFGSLYRIFDFVAPLQSFEIEYDYLVEFIAHGLSNEFLLPLFVNTANIVGHPNGYDAALSIAINDPAYPYVNDKVYIREGTGQTITLTEPGFNFIGAIRPGGNNTWQVLNYHHVKVSGVYNEATGYYDCDFEFQKRELNTTNVVDTFTFSNRIKPFGTGFGFASRVNSYGDNGNRPSIRYDNIKYTFRPPPVPPEAPQFTNYVYTYVTPLGEESAPSPPSETYSEPDANITNVVTIDQPPVLPGYVDRIRLYRSATGDDGTEFLFVAEVYPEDPPTPAPDYPVEYADTILTENLDEVLASQEFDLPPDDLRGLLALPNGIMAGFTGNQLCLSAQNQPHAWPISNRLTTDASIVALAAIDTTVLVLTESHPYTAFGSTPDAFTMTKEEFAQGCQSKRSVAYLRGVGILYACPEGIAAYSGQGRLDIITRGLFTREQWQALNPTSIMGVCHDDRYYFWYDTGSVKAGYILDQRQDGFGLVPLDFHATAFFVDDLTDTLYFCVDSGDWRNIADSAAVTSPANAIVVWNDSSVKQPYIYKSKRYELPDPTGFRFCQIKGPDLASLTIRLFAGGVEYHSQAVSSNREFVLPTPPAGPSEIFEFQLEGTARITQIEFAEAVEELS